MKFKLLNIMRYVAAPLLLLVLTLIVISCEEKEEDGLPDGVTRIYVNSMPKVKYVLGDVLDLTGIKINIVRGNDTTGVLFSDFEKEGITTIPENGTILGFESQFVTINHKGSGKGVILPLDVTNVVVEISVKTPPRTTYSQTDSLKLEDLVVSLTLEDGTVYDLGFAEFKKLVICEPANGTILSFSNKKVVVTYVPTGVTTEIDIDVKPFTPLSASVKELPAKIEYGLGERLALKGLVAEFDMGDGITKIIPFEEFEFFTLTTSVIDNGVLGLMDNIITVAHTPTGVSTTFNLTINDNLVITDLRVKTYPAKSVYNVGEKIDISGLEILVTRNDGIVLEIPAQYLSKVNLSTTPENGVDFALSMIRLVVSHTVFGGTAYAPLKVTIPDDALKVYIAQVNPDGWGFKDNFDLGTTPYSNRGYYINGTLSDKFRDIQWLQTSMDLKLYTGNDQVASINLPGAYTVYLTHNRWNDAPPAWITDSWVNTGEIMTHSNGETYEVYTRDFAEGEEVKLYRSLEPGKASGPYWLLFERK